MRSGIALFNRKSTPIKLNRTFDPAISFSTDNPPVNPMLIFVYEQLFVHHNLHFIQVMEHIWVPILVLEHIQAHIQVWCYRQAHIQVWDHIQALICMLFCTGPCVSGILLLGIGYFKLLHFNMISSSYFIVHTKRKQKDWGIRNEPRTRLSKSQFFCATKICVEKFCANKIGQNIQK